MKDKQLQARKSRFLSALVENHYNITHTCAKLKMPRKSYYEWVYDDPQFKKQVEALRDQEVDWIEDSFRDLVKDKNPQAVIFGLRTRGKNRGYVERTENVNLNFEKVDISFKDPEKEKVVDVATDDVENK